MIIEYGNNFLKEAKKLSKKFKLLKLDLEKAVEDMKNKEDLGIPLGCNLFKKRIINSSIPTGKSGGFRIIIYRYIKNRIVLISIYSKTNQDSLSDDEMKALVKEYVEN